MARVFSDNPVTGSPWGLYGGFQVLMGKGYGKQLNSIRQLPYKWRIGVQDSFKLITECLNYILIRRKLFIIYLLPIL